MSSWELPVFGGSTLIYSLGLLIGGLAAGGNLLRVFAMAGGVLVFWLVWLSSKRKLFFYYTQLGLLTLLAFIGLVAVANVDDAYLRENSVSQEMLKIGRHLFPQLEVLKMHRNTLAGILVVLGVLGLAFGLLGRRPWERLLGGVISLLMLLALLSTNSRGGLVAFIIGGVLLLGLLWRQNRPSHRYLAIWGLSLVSLMVIYLVFSGQYQLFTIDRLLNENGISRLEIWKNTLYLLGDVPLTGLGPGNFQQVYPFYIDPSPTSGRFSQEHAHNLFLQTYVEVGLLGFLAMVTVFFHWAVLCWAVLSGKIHSKGAAFEQKDLNNVPAWGGLATSGALLVYGLTEHSTWNGQFAPLFWLPLALVAGSYRGKSRLSWPFQLVLRYKKMPAFYKRVLPVGGGLLLLFVAWQFWGLVQVNIAGLESQKIWLGTEENNNTNLARIAAFYKQAGGIIGWTSVPTRGEAWVAIQRGETDKASQLLRQLIQKQPDDRRSLLLLADLLADTGHTEEALTLWKQASAAPILVERGRRLLDSSDDTRSESYFLQAIQINPALWDSYVCLEMLYQRHSRTADAIAIMEEAQGFFPGDERILTELNLLKR